jgi:hypothetical protein
MYHRQKLLDPIFVIYTENKPLSSATLRNEVVQQQGKLN